MIHELKQAPCFFEDVALGIKSFEVRINDRDFKVGDLLALNEWNEIVGYTGRSVLLLVDYILSDPAFVKEGYVIMGIKPCDISFAASPFDIKKQRTDYRVTVYERQAIAEFCDKVYRDA